MSEILRCTESFAVGQRVVGKGDIVAADDPIVEGREALFVDPADEFRTTEAAPPSVTPPPAAKRAAKKTAKRAAKRTTKRTTKRAS